MRTQVINTMKANRQIEHNIIFDALCLIDQIIQILKSEMQCLHRDNLLITKKKRRLDVISLILIITQ